MKLKYLPLAIAFLGHSAHAADTPDAGDVLITSPMPPAPSLDEMRENFAKNHFKAESFPDLKKHKPQIPRIKSTLNEDRFIAYDKEYPEENKMPPTQEAEESDPIRDYISAGKSLPKIGEDKTQAAVNQVLEDNKTAAKPKEFPKKRVKTQKVKKVPKNGVKSVPEQEEKGVVVLREAQQPEPAQEPEQNAPRVPLVVLRDIHAKGLENASAGAVLSILKQADVEINGKFAGTKENLNAVSRTLTDSGMFSEAKAYLEGDNLVLVVSENPPITGLEAKGGRSIPNKTIVSALSEHHLEKGKPFNGKVLAQAARDLEGELHNMGKESAQVQVHAAPTEDGKGIQVELNVDEGETTRIEKIEIEDNQALSDRELKRKMNSREKGMLSWMFPSNRLNRHTVNADVEKIVSFYQDNGYMNAQARVELVPVNSKKPRKNIKIALNEGDLYHFGTTEFSLSENLQGKVTLSELEKLSLMKQGAPFSRTKLEQTRERLGALLGKHGHVFPNIEIGMRERRGDNGENIADFQFIVNGGRQFKMGNVNVIGNRKSKDGVIAREFHQQHGEVLNSDKMASALLRLNQTGYFDEVKTSLSATPNEPDTADINVSVKEKRTGMLRGSLGYGREQGFVGGVEVADVNVGGYGKAVSASLNVGKTHQSANLSYKDPYFRKNGTSLEIGLNGDKYDPRKQKTLQHDYTKTEYGVSATAGIPTGEHQKVYVGVSADYMKVKTFANAPLQYRQFINRHGTWKNAENGEFKGAIIKALLGWGKDTTDSLYFPRQGYRVNVNAEAAMPFSKIHYAKAGVKGSYYFPIGRESALMFSGGASLSKSYGKTKDVPFFARYHGGGISGVPLRGLESNTLGAKVLDKDGESVSLGGTRSVHANVELSTPLPFTRENGNTRIGVFVDAASVFDNKTYTAADSDNGKMLYKAPLHRSTFRNELRASSGIAFSWLSPIGMIKLSYGIPLRKRDSDQVQRFQFQLGTTF